MINAPSIALNLSPTTDAAPITSDSTPLDSLNISTAHEDTKDSSKNTPDNPEPNAFVMALSQAYANAVPNTPIETKTSGTLPAGKSTEPAATNNITAELAALNPEGSAVNMTPNGVIDPNVKQDTVTASLDLSSANAPTQTKNPALDWIDSKSFQSLSANPESTTPAKTPVVKNDVAQAVQGQVDMTQVIAGQAPVLPDTAAQTAVAQVLAGQTAVTQNPTAQASIAQALVGQGDVKNSVLSVNQTVTPTKDNSAPVISMDGLAVKPDTSQTVNALKVDNSAGQAPVDNAAPTNSSFKESLAQSIQLASSTALNTAASTDSSAKTDALASSNANAANNAQASGLVNQSMPQGTPLAAKTLEIPVPVTSPQWGQQFSDHVIWMGNNDIKSAVIKIHPEDLGPIEISVKVVDNAASVNIVSHSAQVRDLVDQAMPRLRDMMSNQGLHLSDVQVSADKSSNQSSQNGYANNGQQEMDSDGTDDEVQLVTSVKKQSNRLVDYFA